MLRNAAIYKHVHQGLKPNLKKPVLEPVLTLKFEHENRNLNYNFFNFKESSSSPLSTTYNLIIKALINIQWTFCSHLKPILTETRTRTFIY